MGLTGPTTTNVTARQEQVAMMIMMGQSEAQIARALGIAERTVKTHADNLRVKLDVQRRRQIPQAFYDLFGRWPGHPYPDEVRL